ncbi:hypothetical protein EIP86_005960 [Pleurotus ostreatoroseus]|nr:hypothetical protein EIP86_005960 [Pleurotus ostreatoroseus]
MSLVSLSRHTLSQLKFIVPGALCTWYFDSHHEFWSLVTTAHGWVHTIALAALVLAALTFFLFLYIIFTPLIRGEQPNVRLIYVLQVPCSPPQSVPGLETIGSTLISDSASIISGWTLLVYTLGLNSRMGYFEGLIAASGLYALGFGLIGLIPAPKVYNRT